MVKIKKNELEVLREVRKDARKTFTDISKDTGIPLTTAYENYYRVKGKCIAKEVAIIDFGKLDLSRIILLAESDDQELVNYLKHDPSVNTLFTLENDLIIAEIVVHPGAEIRHMDLMKNFRIKNVKFLNVRSALKTECFVPDDSVM